MTIRACKPPPKLVGRPRKFPVEVDGQTYRSRWRNRTHQAAFRKGARAFAAGVAESPPYGIATQHQLDFRRAWLDGFDAARSRATTILISRSSPQ